MSLVPSLLQAIVGVDGEALVRHAGDKPYVVAPSGQIELASRGLTLEAVNGIVSQLLPADALSSLEEFGAIQQELAALPEFPGESFTVVAARGGDDVWVEIRRRKVSDDDQVPDDFFTGASSTSSVSAPAADQGLRASAGTEYSDIDDVGPLGHPGRSEDARGREAEDDAPIDIGALEVPDAAQLFQGQPTAVTLAPAVAIPVAAAPIPAPELARPAPEPAPAPWVPVVAPSPVVMPPPVAVSPPVVVPPPVAVAPAVVAPPPVAVAPPVAPPPVAAPAPVAAVPEPPKPAPAPPPAPPAPPRVVPPIVAAPPAPSPPATMPPPAAPPPPAAVLPPPPAVVLPMSRSPIRADAPPPPIPVGVSGLDRLLRMAAARGASTLYLSCDARPSVRVDGEIQMLEGEPSHGPNDVESLLLTLMPDRNHEALRSGVATEWISDVDGVGRVRCLSFRDHRGPGGVFRMMPVRAVSAEQLGLSSEVQSLALEAGGLVLVAGSRLSGKRTMISALVDLINHTRRDHVITIESEINVVHERGTSFISQREVRGSYDDVDRVARAALREDPDVLVVESMRTAPLINVALEAAASGQLVIGGFPAHNTTAAVDRIINLYPPENRRQVQLAMAENLRGIVAQVLLRKTGGGRLPAREVLLNTPAVAGIIAEGRTSQLPAAIEGGRRQGMVPLNDSLAAFVQSGAVDVREAYRRAADRAGFLALLKRLGLDTVAIERPSADAGGAQNIERRT
jgi:twitching motility protein PilT